MKSLLLGLVLAGLWQVDVSNKQPRRTGQYSISTAAGLHSPADSSTFIWGCVPSILPAGADYYVCVVPKAGYVKRVDLIVFVAGTLATTENATLSLRVNEATDTALSSVVKFNAARQIYSSSLSVWVEAGDRLELKLVSPAWATNPTNVLYSGNIFIEGVLC